MRACDDQTLPLGRPARVGIVGLGQIYDLTIRGYLDNPDVEMVALCDTDPERLAGAAAEWPTAACVADLDELLAVELDVVEVLVPTPLHADVVVRALRGGVHVNVQKPFANDLVEADRMLAARDAADDVPPGHGELHPLRAPARLERSWSRARSATPPGST